MLDQLWPWLTHFGRVTKELLITIFFSMSPILLSALVEASWTASDFKSAFVDNFKTGEVFIYTAAFLAPYMVNRLGEGIKGIFKEVCFYLFWGVLLCGAYLFVNLRIESALGQEIKILDATLHTVSYFVVFITSFIWYYSIWPLHYKTTQNPQIKAKEEMNNLEKELNQRLGK
jgi:hypothetical protein